MKAIVHTQYGPPDVLQFTDIAKPTANDDEVLIKLYAASANPLDLFHMRGVPMIRLIPGLRTLKQQVLDVAEALRYLEEGHAQGKIVLTVEHF